MELTVIICLVVLLITSIILAIVLSKKDNKIIDLINKHNNLQARYDTLDSRNDRLKNELYELRKEKDTEWKLIKDEATENAEYLVEYELDRAKETEESLICANKDLHNVIAELRNLFAKTQQETASETVKALVPWKTEEING
tara:strand:- start:255 stop:680 length:426 start_codon:yes stop_codon:yes gene_type:complete